MHVTDQTFENNRLRIENALDSKTKLNEDKLDEAAKLIFLNAQFAASLDIFQAKAPEMSEAELSDFIMDFETQIYDFDALITEYISTL